VRHVRLLLPSLLMLVGGASCATTGSAPGSTPAPQSDRVVLVDDAGTTYRTSVAPNAKAAVAAAPDRAFAATRTAFEELGIPVASADPNTGQVSSGDFWKMRTLGKTSLSAYLECGRAATGPIAELYRVYLNVSSVVRADGKGGSQLETSVTASARNIEGTSSNRVACGATGQLEERIRQAVVRKLAPPTP